MDMNDAAKKCAGCPLCKFTRNRKKEDFFYNVARRVQSTCPICAEVNKTSGKDAQKSSFF